MIPRNPSIMLVRVILLVSFLLALSVKASAQSAADRPARGVVPNGSYSVSDIENINLQNGNVNLQIPLASLPPIAGSKLSWTITANYNSKIWNMLRVQHDDGGQTWAPYVVSHPSADGNWVIGGIYTMIFRNAMDDFQRLPYPSYSGLPQWDLDLLNTNNWWKVLLRMPDGSEHEFRPTDYSPYSGSQEFLKGFYNLIPNGSAMRYFSVDGTYMYARITSHNDWTVYLPDGTQIVQTPDNVQRLKDTNGNKIKIFTDSNGTHYQDEQTGRELRLKYNTAGDTLQLWYNTVGGVAQHIDIVFGTTLVQGKVYTINGAFKCVPERNETSKQGLTT